MLLGSGLNRDNYSEISSEILLHFEQYIPANVNQTRFPLGTIHTTGNDIHRLKAPVLFLFRIHYVDPTRIVGHFAILEDPEWA